MELILTFVEIDLLLVNVLRKGNYTLSMLWLQWWGLDMWDIVQKEKIMELATIEWITQVRIHSWRAKVNRVDNSVNWMTVWVIKRSNKDNQVLVT